MKKVLPFLILFVAVAVLGYFVRAQPPKQQTTVNQQDKVRAPEFSLTDYDGKTIKLSDFSGKPVIVNFWASWCLFCVEEMLDFATAQDEFKDQVIIIGINRAESRRESKQFTDAYKVTDKMILLLDPKDSYYQKVGGFTMPETIFIDRDGNIFHYIRGPMQLDKIRERTMELIES